MAIYHLSVQAISRASGRSATGAAAYRAGELIVDERTGEAHDYTRKRGVLHAEILAPTGAPDWALDRGELWNRVELAEKRKDAQLCRELNIALPHELTSFERLDLIRRYVKKNFVAHGMVADVCLHAPSADEDNKNYHAHIMLSMRTLEIDGFGKKARDWNSVGMLESWRSSWAKMANEALARAGHDARIDHRSHEARGLDEVPSQHHGPAVAGLLRRGEHSEVAERQEAERAAREAAQLEAQLAIAKAQATAADAELQAAEAEEAEHERAQRQAAQEQAERMAERQRQADQAAQAAARLAQERAQAEQAQAERILLAVAEAERQRQAEQAAQARQQMAQAERAERERLHQEQAQQAAQAEQQRLATLVQARRALKDAEKQLELAVQAESQARESAEALKNAHDWALDGQKEAAQSLLKTAQAMIKTPGWLRDITAYEKALQALSKAVLAVQAARKAVASAWQRVLGLDPAERTAHAERQSALEARQAEWLAQGAPKPARVAAPAPAPWQAPQVPRAAPAPHQGQYDQDEDDPPGPAPGMSR